MTAPVNFELAKLLKEKGWNTYTSSFWKNPNGTPSLHIGVLNYNNRTKEDGSDLPAYSAPTIAEVVDWLRVNYSIWISVHLEMCRGYEGYNFNFEYINDKKRTIKEQEIQYKTLGETVFNSPTEAYEAAIEYTLTNLI